MSADRNLLYGMLAYRNGFVTREQLLDAFAAWMTHRQAPVGQLLRERASLTEDDQRFLDAFVERQLGQPGEGDRDEPLAPEAQAGLATEAKGPGHRDGPALSRRAGTGLPEIMGGYRLRRGCTPGAGWARSTSPRTRNCDARWP
ncbi:MAG: hypothetical protein U0797_22885 [Gemmataceae bacterium]